MAGLRCLAFLPVILCLQWLFPAQLQAQEAEQVYIKGRHYLALNVHALDKYAHRLERTQHQLLNRLRRREKKLARQLMRKDSAAYARFKASPLTYDSIARLAAHPDSTAFAAKALRSGNKTLDTLKQVYGFVQSKAGAVVNSAGNLAGATGLEGYGAALNGLQGRLSYDQYITSLTSQRTTNLESIAGNNNAITGMQKELYYAKSKIAEWKKLADDPSRAEELALEYLQGTKGFKLDAGSVGAGSGVTTPSGNMSADELEKMGFQTKRQLTAGLQQKYGSSLGAVQSGMGTAIDKWQGEAQSLQGQLNQTRQSIAGLKHMEKPKFKINPMRGLPFRERIEKSWGFQSTRVTTDGKPAMLQLAGMAGYRFSPKLSAGLGAALQVGLGQSWSQIRFTFEGIGLRSYLAWQWQYGFGLYGGYERTYKNAAFKSSAETSPAGIETIRHDRPDYSEALLAGITKSYRINAKWNGAIQLLYDVWWQEKGLRSPIVLRFNKTSN